MGVLASLSPVAKLVNVEKDCSQAGTGHLK